MMGLNLTYMDNYYFKPWIRAPPYMIGIWTGWFLHRTKNSKLYISKVREVQTVQSQNCFCKLKNNWLN